MAGLCATLTGDGGEILWRFDDSPQLRPSNAPVIDYQPGPLCASCGKCCKIHPGQFYPADLGPDVETRKAKARKLLLTGDYQVDSMDGDPSGPFKQAVFHLRPATTHMRGWIFDRSWGGECALLGPDGCTLAYADRPQLCRSLRPAETPEEGCMGLTKYDLAMAWINDSDWLREVGAEVTAAMGRPLMGD